MNALVKIFKHELISIVWSYAFDLCIKLCIRQSLKQKTYKSGCFWF